MNMTVDFAAGTQAASAYRTLNPGQCSWVDRGFRNGEPRQIRFEIVYFAQQRHARHGSAVDRSPTAAESYPDAQNVPQYLTSSDLIGVSGFTTRTTTICRRPTRDISSRSRPLLAESESLRPLGHVPVMSMKAFELQPMVR